MLVGFPPIGCTCVNTTTWDYDEWSEDDTILGEFEIYGANHNASASCGNWDGGSTYWGRYKWCYVADEESCVVKTQEWEGNASWVECEGIGWLKLLAYLLVTLNILNIKINNK